jgi:hypothetical protein
MSASTKSKSANKNIYKATELIALAPNVEALIKLLSFSDPKPLGDKGMKREYVRFNGQALYVQTPKMRANMGLSKWPVNKDDPSSGTNDSINLSYGEDEESKALHKFNTMYDEALRELGKGQMCPTWFNKKTVSDEIIDDKYTPIVRKSKDKDGNPTKYPDTLKLKLGKNKDGKYLVELYDSKRNLVANDDFETELSKGCECVAIINYQYIWHGKQGFGQSIMPTQIKTNKQEKIRGYAFLDEEEDVSAGSSAPVQEKEVQKLAVEVEKKVVVESDDDSESEKSGSESDDSDSSSEEEEEPPKPAPKGKGRAPAKK